MPISRLTRLQCLRLQTDALHTPWKQAMKVMLSLKLPQLQSFYLVHDNEPRFPVSRALPKHLLQLHQECKGRRHCTQHGDPFPLRDGSGWGYGPV